MALTYAQLTAASANSLDADPTGAAKAEARLARKSGLYDSLTSVGVVGAWSWASGSVPSSLLEIYSWSLEDFDEAVAFLSQGALSPTAEGDALTQLSHAVYDNDRASGTFTVARELLTDTAGNGPFTFQPTSVSFSVGLGGLRFDGFDLLGTGAVTLPRNGSVYVYVKSEAAGSAYSTLSVNAVNTFARGKLGGVTVTNDATWLTFSGALAGTDGQADAALQAQNTSKWGTQGLQLPKQSAYEFWARAAQPTQVTRVSVLTNLDLLDPGRVDVIVAGPAGAVTPDVVLACQNNIAPTQIGGLRIPETARCVVTSAANHAIAVSATLFVQKEVNTSEFQAQVSTDFATYAAAVPIGGGPLGLVSYERLLGILEYRAGLSPSVVYDVSNFLPAADVSLLYNEVPIFSLTLTFTSV